MNFEVVIGLEIHVELNTKTKMFSSAPVTFGEEPNTMIAPLDMGFPGTLPVVNKAAVIHGIRVANALNMTIDNCLHFDRKNYFYSDLPKGYQITQNERPIGKNGYIDIETSKGLRRIEIERVHMEEDTCKQLHFDDYTLLNYNRAGVPLLEIVSRPTIRSGEEAMKYVETIKSIVVFLGVSDGKMEEGSLRCDVNISLRPFGSEVFGTKVEIKNINSISYIQKAIDFEIARQSKLLLQNICIQQETRRYDESVKETILMRVKTDAVDYKYFPETNIIPIKLSEEFIAQTIATSPELASSKAKRYINNYKLSEYDTNIIVSDKDTSLYFDELCKLGTYYKSYVNWINGDLASFLNKNHILIKDYHIIPSMLHELIHLVESKDISVAQGKQILAKMNEEKVSVQEAKKLLNITTQVNDEELIIKLVNEVLDQNNESIEDFKAGRDKALGFLIGQVMKKSQGKVNPKLASKFMIEKLKERIQ